MRVFNSRRTSFIPLFLTLFMTVQAARIEYVASDLADLTTGEDLWRYDYTVSGRNFLQSEFFDTYFPASLYEELVAGPTPTADWDVLILQQPNPVNFPPFDAGIFDAFALAGTPSLAGAFWVSFIYLGSGSPGAQLFRIFDAESNLVESGLTTAPVGVIPEPSTGALFLIGLAACLFHLHRRSGIRRRA